MLFVKSVQASETLRGHEEFSPPWLYRNGHVQTLAGMYLHSSRVDVPEPAAVGRSLGEVLLSDGDRLVYQDECPAGWKLGQRVAVLLHGLGGSHASPYMGRIARHLNAEHIRTFRLDWRGCGAGAGLARYPYHSGRSEDLEATVALVRQLCPGSPISVLGFSLGGNVALKLLGDPRHGSAALTEIDQAIAVSPPIDLLLSVRAMQTGWARIYDHYFCRSCTRAVAVRLRERPDTVVPPGWDRMRPRSLYEFDDLFTAPVCGFASAADYYAQSNSLQFLSNVRVPTLIIAAQDDPLIPFSQYRAADFSSTTSLLAPRHGGHLGFCTFRGHHWLDQQIVNWVTRDDPDGGLESSPISPMIQADDL